MKLSDKTPSNAVSYRLSDIISQILEVANGGGVTKTNIMYKAFLSYAQMKEYLTIVTESDLLCYDTDTQTFKTNEKGLASFVLVIMMMVEPMKKKENLLMFAYHGDVAPGASSAATHLLYSTWIVIKGHHCLSRLRVAKQWL